MPAPDTHNTAAQASAYKLIQLLQATYPEPQSLEAQRLLSRYLQHLANLAEPEKAPALDPPLLQAEIAALKAEPSIQGTMQMLQWITDDKSRNWTAEDKRLAYEQIQVIVNLFPGNLDYYTPQQQHWSINTACDANGKQLEKLETSPATALNLVCKAIFDMKHCFSLAGKKEINLRYRVESFFTWMRDLRRQTNEGFREKCSAGLQHDLLYLLNKVYLGSDNQPVELLMDTQSFVKNSLSLFVAKKIEDKCSEDEANSLILAWMQYLATPTVPGDSSAPEAPILVWLRKIMPAKDPDADAAWKLQCGKFLRQHCWDFGLNPPNNVVEGFISAEIIADLPVPTEHNTMLPLVMEIFKQQSFLLPPSIGDISQHPYAIFDLGNKALATFKAGIGVEHLSTKSEKIENLKVADFFSALDCLTSLYRYRDLTIFIGSEEVGFKTAQEELKSLLLDYFTEYSIGKGLPTDKFETIQHNYKKQERKFLNQDNVQFIENLFAVVRDMHKSDVDKVWHKLMALQTSERSTHPLLLSDAAIKAWIKQATATPDEGDNLTIIDVTPYAINRLLLHGLLQPPHQWSTLYCKHLLLFIDWLKQPSSADEALSLKTLKQSYTHTFLNNLRFIASLAQSLDGDLMQLISSQFFIGQSFFYNMLHSNFLLKVFAHNFTEAQFSKILTAVAGELGTWIENAHELSSLLNSYGLTDGHHAQILTAVAGQLGTWIKNTGELVSWLNFYALTPEHRTQLLTAVAGQLGAWIKNTDGLVSLLNLNTLTPEHRTQIFTAVAGQLGTWIKNTGELFSLLNLNTLTPEHCAQILTAVAGQLDTWIKNTDELFSLLKRNRLTKEHRAQILTAVAGQLSIWIKNDDELASLFGTIEDLTIEQLHEFCEVARKSPPTYIKSFYFFYRILCRLPINTRPILYELMRESLGGIITSDKELYMVMNCLPTEQSAALWESKKTSPPDLVTSRDVWNIMHPLSPERRSEVFISMKKLLPNLIKSRIDFRLVMHYLSPNQRSEVCIPIQKLLPNLIKSRIDFELVLDYLSPEQRSEVCISMQKLLPNFIQKPSDFHVLLYFSIPQLEEVSEVIKDLLKKTILSSDNFLQLREELLVYKRRHEFSRNMKLDDTDTFGLVSTYMLELLPTMIKSSSDFAYALYILPDAQRSALYDSMKNSLPGFIKSKSIDDFGNIMQFLSNAQIREFCTANPGLVPSVNNIQHLGGLTGEQKNIIAQIREFCTANEQKNIIAQISEFYMVNPGLVPSVNNIQHLRNLTNNQGKIIMGEVKSSPTKELPITPTNNDRLNPR